MLTSIRNRDKFFEETSKHYLDILEEYKETNLPKLVGPWEVTPLYDILNCKSDSTNLFKSISDNISKIDGYDILSIAISSFPSGNSESPHIDNHPTNGNFKRYHLPLQLTDTSFLYVNIGGEWERYPWELGSWMQFTGINHLHYPLNEDKDGKSRIVLLMDTYEGSVPDKELYEYYEEIQKLGWVSNFRPYYDKYIQSKTLL